MNKYNKACISAADFIDMHYTKKMRLKEIAELLNMYPDHLSLYVRNILKLEIIHYGHVCDENISEELRLAIISDYNIIKCVKEVSKIHSLSRGTVTKILKVANVDIKKNKNIRQSAQLKGRNIWTTDEYNNYCKNVNISVLEEYNGSERIIKHQCDICEHVWLASPGNVIHNKSGCPHCASKANGRLKALSPEKYVERLAELCPNLEVLEDYVAGNVKILHRCKTCNYEWKTLPINRPTESGCRACVTPSGQFGKHTIINGIEFDSIIESECYIELLNFISESDITHKKWYSSGQYCSDFYIKKLDLWIEVSSYNTIEYLEKIWKKRKLVNNFVFFNSPSQIADYFKEKLNDK